MTAYYPGNNTNKSRRVIYNAQYNYIKTSTNSGGSWTQRSPESVGSVRYYSVASNSAGDRLIVNGGGQLYTSLDSGVTWTPQQSNRIWSGLGSNSAGDRLIASDSGGQIYIGVYV